MKLYLETMGLATPLGCRKDEAAETLFAGSQAGLQSRDDLLPCRSIQVGVVPHSLPDVPHRLSDYDCRNNRLMLAALHEIESEIAQAVREFGRSRVGVVMGTSTAGLSDGEEALRVCRADGRWPDHFRYEQQEIGNVGLFLAEYLGLDGPAYTVATACSSSAKAFASAWRLIAAGFCDAVLAGGVDTLCRMTAGGFGCLEALSATVCNPFSRNRDGITIGEGAAIFLVSRRPSTVTLLGVGESSDAHHVSAPDPTGRGAVAAMRSALTAARLPADAVEYVNLHGTATPLNDAMEGKAVAEVFGTDVACSSTKPLTGHMLGAAGAGEAAILWLALHPDFSDGRMPPHVWDGERDPEIPSLWLVERGGRRAPLSRTAMISNSFAFGGSNASVLLGRGW